MKSNTKPTGLTKDQKVKVKETALNFASHLDRFSPIGMGVPDKKQLTADKLCKDAETIYKWLIK